MPVSTLPAGIELGLSWLRDTAWSTGLRESLWAYPMVDTAHVLGLIAFVGAAIVLDLRLVGLALPALRVSEVVERTRRPLYVGFAAMATTGLLLFFANPLKFATNPFFQAKVGLLAVAGLNAGLFHLTTYRHVAAWDCAVAPPGRARIAGSISLVAWMAVIAVGRLIAFYETGAGV